MFLLVLRVQWHTEAAPAQCSHVQCLLTEPGLLAACVQVGEGISAEHTKFCARGTFPVEAPGLGTTFLETPLIADDSIGWC